MKNLVFKDKDIALLKNGRVFKIFSYKEIDNVRLVHTRHPRWILQFVLGLSLILLPVLLIIKFGVTGLLADYAMNIATAFAVLSGYSLFFLLGIFGVRAINKNYFLEVNHIRVQLDNSIIENWNSLVDQFTIHGVPNERIHYLT